MDLISQPLLGRTAGLLLTLGLCLAPGCRLWPNQSTASRQHPEMPKAPTLLELNDKQSIDVQFGLARSYEQSGNRERAATLYRQILKADPKHAGAAHRLAIIYDQQALFVQSEEMFTKALKLRPGDPDIFCDLGYSQYQQRRWEDAERNFRQAIAIEPAHRRAHNHLGLVLASTGRTDHALQEFRQAGCSLAQARINVGLLMTLEGNLDAATEQYELALAADPNIPEARQHVIRLDQLLAQQGKAAAPASTSVAAAQPKRSPPVAQAPRPSPPEGVVQVGWVPDAPGQTTVPQESRTVQRQPVATPPAASGTAGVATTQREDVSRPTDKAGVARIR